jgi:hypothetical protein
MTLQPISLKPILILSSHLWPGIPSGVFLGGNILTMLNIILVTSFQKQCSCHFHLTRFCICHTFIRGCENLKNMSFWWPPMVKHSY